MIPPAGSVSSAAAPHLPTPEQRLLLHALLGPKETTVENWQAWRRRVPLDDVDHGSYRAVPLLHHVLRERGVVDPDLARYQGVARKCWYENQLTFHRAEEVIDGLQRAGLPVLVMKGMAMAHRYYPEPGLRPMADGDLLVPFAQAAAAVDWMCDHGWAPIEGHTRDTVKTYALHKQHGMNFRHPGGSGVDLHWKVFNVFSPVAAERAFWAAAGPLRLRRVETRTLCPTDHLLHVCAHGIVWNRVPALRWIIDATLILRRDRAVIDWDRLVDLTGRLRIGLFVVEALTWLDREFAADLPAEVPARLRALPVAAWQRREYELMTSADPLAMRDYYVRQRFRRMSATCDDWRRLPAWRARLRFLQLHWELESPAQVLALAARRIVGKSRARLCRLVRVQGGFSRSGRP